MPEFPVNPLRPDPYKGTNFEVYFGGATAPVPGVCYVSGLVWNTQVVTYREGGSPNQFVVEPGLTTFEPVVLSRGRTQDTSFEDWAVLVWGTLGGTVTPMQLNEMRKNVRIDLVNEAHQVVMRYILHRCWPSRYQALTSWMRRTLPSLSNC
jgi:phage tail-like protein